MRVGSTLVANVTSAAGRPPYWNGGVCVLTYEGAPTATFAFRDFSLTRRA